MTRISFATRDGSTLDVDATDGHSVMETALAAGVDGLPAECGGACACATCHVYVLGGWEGRLPAPDEIEETMLEFAEERRPESRLSCQLRVGPRLAGFTFQVP